MTQVQMYLKTVSIEMKTGPDIRDITFSLEEALQASGIANGVMTVCMVGSTGSVTTIEYEQGVVSDLKRAIEELAPPGADYAHELAWRDGNGHSHVQAALMGPSLAVPIRNSRLKLGTWQQVVAINHDNKSRTRQVEVTLLGTA
jgi:secondary thiamine-phosphate synthase enzyme